MNFPTVIPAPNVLIVSDHSAFRAQLEHWLPAPAFHVVEANEGTFAARAREFPPQLLMLDSTLDTARCLAQAAALVPGVPYVIIPTEKLDPTNPHLCDIAAGLVAREEENPSRESVLSAIAHVAPAVAARFK